jgi:hypothetical protein
LDPTSPVAPTTATFIFYGFEWLKIKKPSLWRKAHYLEYTKYQTPSPFRGFLVFFFVYVVITLIEA